jgi:predicted RNA-binding Zn-ribbon protein involved in translation (DUF1610 family)
MQVFPAWNRPDLVESKAMRARPVVKRDRKNRFKRCPKCGKQMQIHTKRCKTCHLPQA